MNERILELAKLAEKYADEETNAFTDDSGQWKVIWNETYDKKFAELIIRECSAVANHFSDGHIIDEFGRKMFQYRTDIAQEINEYFGVKE